MKPASALPKSVFYGLLAVSMAVLAADFLFIYIPLSGWILQAVLVGVYLEYLGLKKTIFIVVVLEVFFMASYGGVTALAAILSIVGACYFLPVIVALYFLVLAVALLLGYITNHLFHKIHLFERISQCHF
jgi:hypothetical protein